MTDDLWDGDDEAAGRLVPLYVLLGGRVTPRNVSLDLATQVVARQVSTARLEREYEQIVRLCANWMSLAEIGAYLRFPLTITRVMVDVLLEQGYLEVGAPAQQTIVDRNVLATVLAHLEKL
ncbi:MAG TPA: DUF742 domain-containing protein [Rugosimonospora sp.]|nr:DUF742 domain-containing protein [Rugosimonospora sp.]